MHTWIGRAYAYGAVEAVDDSPLLTIFFFSSYRTFHGHDQIMAHYGQISTILATTPSRKPGLSWPLLGRRRHWRIYCVSLCYQWYTLLWYSDVYKWLLFGWTPWTCVSFQDRFNVGRPKKWNEDNDSVLKTTWHSLDMISKFSASVHMLIRLQTATPEVPYIDRPFLMNQMIERHLSYYFQGRRICLWGRITI